MIEDIRVVEWVEEYTLETKGGTTVTTTKERYDIQVKYQGTDLWVPVQRVVKGDVE
jgi:hypothetical protein